MPGVGGDPPQRCLDRPADDLGADQLVAAGVIDPTKVVRSALQNAASIASLLLTTEAVVAHLPDDTPAPARAAGGGGFGGF